MPNDAAQSASKHPLTSLFATCASVRQSHKPAGQHLSARLLSLNPPMGWLWRGVGVLWAGVGAVWGWGRCGGVLGRWLGLGLVGGAWVCVGRRRVPVRVLR